MEFGKRFFSKALWTFFCFHVVILSSGCSGFKIKLKDSVWLGSLGDEDGAAEFHTMKPDKRVLSHQEFLRMWGDRRRPMICTYAETFADWKAIIEKLCSQLKGKCVYEEVQKVAKFFRRTQRYWLEVPSSAAAWRDFPGGDPGPSASLDLDSEINLELEAPL